MRTPNFAIVAFLLFVGSQSTMSRIGFGQLTPWQPSLRLIDDSGKEVEGQVAVCSLEFKLRPGEQKFFARHMEIAKPLPRSMKSAGSWVPEPNESEFMIQSPSGILDLVKSFDRLDYVMNEREATKKKESYDEFVSSILPDLLKPDDNHR